MAKKQNVHDFDSFWKEKQKKPLIFTAFGEEYALPAEIPASITIKMIRMQKKYGDESEIPRGDQIDIALEMFGEDQLEKLMSNQEFSIEKLTDIIQWAMSQYQGKPAEKQVEEAIPGDGEKNSST